MDMEVEGDEDAAPVRAQNKTGHKKVDATGEPLPEDEDDGDMED